MLPFYSRKNESQPLLVFVKHPICANSTKTDRNHFVDFVDRK